MTKFLIRASELARRVANDGGETLRVLDVRSPRRYKAEHIPGAVNFPLSAIVSIADGAQSLADPCRFAELSGSAGIDETVEVVVYGERGGVEAAYAAWAFEYYGHDRMAFLDGGIEAWRRAGGALSTDVPRVPGRTFRPDVRPSLRAAREEILARLADPDLQLIDTRTPEEYSGAVAVGGRGGHIPGAIRVDWERSLNDDLTFRDPDSLACELRRAGVDPLKETILYCLSGPRAAHVYLALKLLGNDRVRLYDRSWSEWGGDPNFPVEEKVPS